MNEAVKSFQRPGSLVDELVRVLTDRIVRGDLAPGARLIEERVAESFDVSRPPIREAFRILQREGLVVVTAGKGARVRELAAEEVMQIYECRAVLEGLAARVAARRVTAQALLQFERLVASMEEAVNQGDVDGYFRLNVEFHDLVGEIAGNPVLEDLVRRLGTQVLRLRYTSLSMAGRAAHSLAIHQQIVAAFEAGDGDGAERLTRELILDAAAALTDQLERGGASFTVPQTS